MDPQGRRMAHQCLIFDVTQLELNPGVLVSSPSAGGVSAWSWATPRARRGYAIVFVHNGVRTRVMP